MNVISSLKQRWIEWVWNHTPNCAEMSRLASQPFEQPLSLRTRIRMRLHHLICVWCQRYGKQLRFFHAAAPRLDERTGFPADRGLPVEAKRRIVLRLQTEWRNLESERAVRISNRRR